MSLKQVPRSADSPQEVMNAFECFSRYHHIWRKDRESTIQLFVQENPLLAEFESQILYYRDLELEINAEPEIITVGALALYTGELCLIVLLSLLQPGHYNHSTPVLFEYFKIPLFF